MADPSGGDMPDRPNVIVCMCDQLRSFEVGCYGNEVIRTPHIDRLAAEGVRFKHAVSNNPVCMPARSCLISGQYSRTCMGSLNNHKALDRNGREILPEYPVDTREHLRDPTLPEQFKALGYDTALFGKWHIHPAPGIVGFDYSLFPRVHHRHTGQTFVENTGPGDVVDRFSVAFEADKVGEYLGNRGDTPFFMFYSISPPHMPLLDAPQRYVDMYNPDEIPLRPNVNIDGELPFHENWFKIYLWDFLYYDEHLPYTESLPDGFDLQKLIALYYGMTTWVDDTVGRLMDALEKNGLADDTIVVFLSDHGDNLGSHHQFNKGLLIEESIRIPMIFHAPKRWSPDIRTEQVSQIIDVMPTLLDTCGAEIPDKVQGRSLAPLLTGACNSLDDFDAFIETGSGQIGLRTPAHLYGIRLEEDRRTTRDDCDCFYDLEADPYERENLAGKQDDGLQKRLRKRLVEWHEKTPWMNDKPSQ